MSSKFISMFLQLPSNGVIFMRETLIIVVKCKIHFRHSDRSIIICKLDKIKTKTSQKNCVMYMLTAKSQLCNNSQEVTGILLKKKLKTHTNDIQIFRTLSKSQVNLTNIKVFSTRSRLRERLKPLKLDAILKLFDAEEFSFNSTTLNIRAGSSPLIFFSDSLISHFFVSAAGSFAGPIDHMHNISLTL